MRNRTRMIAAATVVSAAVAAGSGAAVAAATGGNPAAPVKTTSASGNPASNAAKAGHDAMVAVVAQDLHLTTARVAAALAPTLRPAPRTGLSASPTATSRWRAGAPGRTSTTRLTDGPSAPVLAAAALAEAGELRVLINDLAGLARDGRASFHVEDVRLDLLAERVAARAAGRSPGLRYELDCRPTLVRGDPDALERAIGNLVDNALKWSPPGGRIRIAAAGGAVEVSDDGPGIPADDLPYIFDRFYRSATARALPGSGLGLAIVRRIAGLHGGTAGAIPQEHGVMFRLSVPETAEGRVGGVLRLADPPTEPGEM